MGNSASTRNSVINDTNISITKDFVTNNIVQTSVSSGNQLLLTVDIVVGKNCPISVNQSIKNNVQIVNLSDQSVADDLANNLEQQLDSSTSQNAEVLNGFAALTAGNSATSVNSVRNTIKKVIRQSTRVNNINKIVTDSYNAATGKLTYMYCEDSPIKWDQSIVSDIVAKNILQNIQESLLSDDTISSLVSKADQKSKNTNKGADDLVKAFTGPIAISSIAAALICIAFIIGLTLLFNSPAGQNAIRKGANAASIYATGGMSKL